MCTCTHCGWATIFIRSIHTVLCLGVPLTLVVKDSELHRSLFPESSNNPKDLAYGFCYIGLLLFSLITYFIACFLNPGYLPFHKQRKHKRCQNKNNDNADEDDDEDTSDDSGDSENSENSNMIKCQIKDHKYHKCDFCEIQQPMRSKHCEDCGRCVRKYDHHCPWLEACVGERNHKFFWLFLLSTSVLVVWTIKIAWGAIVDKWEWGDWIKVNFVFFIDIVILIFSGLIVFGLFCFHSYLMMKGMTTWEAVTRERITYLKYLDDDYNPFDEGVCKNIFHFLCSCNVRNWETLYSGHANVNHNAGVV